MGPKKAGGKDEQEDNSTKDLLNIYRKQVKENEVIISKVLESKLIEACDNESHLPEALINEKVGELGIKAFTTALMKVK
jgi:hypothetical protein